MKLLPDQKTCIGKLSKLKVGALFMEPGTGKTRTTVELVNSIDTDFVLYLAPYRGLNTVNHKESIPYQVSVWEGFNAPTSFVGVESIQQSDRIYLETIKRLELSKNPVIVLDESLKIKNAEAKRTKRILHLSTLAKYKLILNGTPVSRDYLDLKSQMDFLSPKILGMSNPEYKNNFCEYVEVTIKKDRRTRTVEYIKKYHNLDVLHKLIEPYVFFSELDLDIGIQTINVPYELSEEIKQRHEEMLDRILSNEWLMAKPNFFLSLIQKLQNNYSRSPEKFEIIKHLIDDKTVIVAKFIKTQEELKLRFPEIRVLSWQKDAQCLNLQDYNKMILFDKHLDYGLFDQLKRRIYRIAQKEDCLIYNLTGNVGLENFIDTCNSKKENLLSNYKKLSKEEFI